MWLFVFAGFSPDNFPKTHMTNTYIRSVALAIQLQPDEKTLHDHRTDMWERKLHAPCARQCIGRATKYISRHGKRTPHEHMIVSPRKETLLVLRELNPRLTPPTLFNHFFSRLLQNYPVLMGLFTLSVMLLLTQVFSPITGVTFSHSKIKPVCIVDVTLTSKFRFLYP